VQDDLRPADPQLGRGAGGKLIQGSAVVAADFQQPAPELRGLIAVDGHLYPQRGSQKGVIRAAAVDQRLQQR